MVAIKVSIRPDFGERNMNENLIQSVNADFSRVPEQIATPRLILLKPELSHAAGFARGMNQASVSRNTASFPKYVPALSAEFWVFRARSNFERGIAFAYVITRQGSDEVVGVMDIFTNGDGQREIGYWIARDHWGQGYATEAGHAVIDTLVAILGITEIEAGIYEDNSGSGRVLEKLGFQHMGAAPLLFSVSRGRSDPGYRYKWTTQ